MQNALARVRNPALRQGLIFGIVLGIILLAVSFIGLNNLTFTLILCLLAAFIAGLRASQETGRMTTATLAGLWTGLIGTFIPSIILTLLFLINIDTYRKNAQTIANQQHLHITYTNSLLLEGLLINFLLLLLVGILFGACGGAVGGILGRRRALQPSIERSHERTSEPPSVSESEELPATTKAEELPTASEAEEPPSSSETGDPLSDTSSKKRSSSTQQAE